MSPDDRHDRVREANAFQNLGADQRVNLHFLELFGSKAAGLRDDVLRNCEFADIVQKRGGMERFELWSRQTKFLADLNGIDPNTLQVFVRGVILGFNSE